MTAAEIAGAVAAGDRSARSVIEDALARADGDDLNTFTAVGHDSALARADALDSDIAAGARVGPLAGVPVALKDLIDHAGAVTTCGSSFYRHEATRSATVVERLEQAGAIIVGRTGLHEFAYGFSSENQWFGPVRNPWDPTLSPGGSSGGSGSAVGADITPVSIGTDTGGSVRVPAALCGVVGLKVTHGRVSTRGVFPLSESLDTVGPLTRTCADARLVYDVIRGGDAEDPWSVDHLPDSDGETPMRGLRVGIPARWISDAPLTAETHAAFSTAIDQISDLGASVIELDAPTLAPHADGWILSAAEAASVHRAWMADDSKVYGDEVRERIRTALDVSLDSFIRARRWQASLVAAFRRAFHDVDVLATPSVGHPRKVIGIDDIEVPGGPQPYRMVLAAFSATVNQSWCPAIALPLLGTGRPPHSIQFVAPWWGESTLLDIGESLENAGIVGAEPAA